MWKTHDSDRERAKYSRKDCGTSSRSSSSQSGSNSIYLRNVVPSYNNNKNNQIKSNRKQGKRLLCQVQILLQCRQHNKKKNKEKKKLQKCLDFDLEHFNSSDPFIDFAFQYLVDNWIIVISLHPSSFLLKDIRLSCFIGFRFAHI